MRVDRRDINLRAQCRLRHRHRNSHVNVVPRTRKYRIRSCPDNQVKITWSSAIRPRVALAGEPYPLPITRTRLDAKLQRFLLRDDTLAVARRTCILHLARPAATRALDVELHPSAHL